MLTDFGRVMWQITDQFMVMNRWSQIRLIHWASYDAVRGKTVFGGCLEGVEVQGYKTD